MAQAVSGAGTPATQGEQPRKSDAVLNLFATEVVEENTLGKFAASLKEIDVQNLLSDATDIRDRLRGKKR